MMGRRAVLGGAAAGVAAAAAAQEVSLRPGFADALLVVDVQNCFMPGGSLAVPRGDEVPHGGDAVGGGEVRGGVARAGRERGIRARGEQRGDGGCGGEEQRIG